MRKEFIKCDNKYEAIERCPWYGFIARVPGGYMCFETATQYQVWKETDWKHIKCFQDPDLEVENEV